MKRVIIESPYAGSVNRNVRYARLCLRDSLRRGEAPLASHLLYTQALNDDNEEQRQWGIDAGLEWLKVAEKHVFYVDYGYSKGMQYALRYSLEMGNIDIEERELFKKANYSSRGS